MTDRVRRKNLGFTLVELVVVVVIILILAAVLVPNVVKYVSQAQKANCQSDASSILSQVQADYAHDLGALATGEEKYADEQGTYKVDKLEIKLSTTDFDTSYTASGIGGGYCVDQATKSITSFYYCNGTYTSIWISGTGWKTNG